MSYASSLRRRKSSRRNSILRYLESMDTIAEEDDRQIKSVNWNSFVDPRNEKHFEKKVVQYLLPNWEHEQDVFDDQLLKSMFHWNPDHYNKLPNKTRRNRNRNTNSFTSRSDNNLERENNCIPDSIKKFGPPPGLTKPIFKYENKKLQPSTSVIISDSDSDSKNFRSSSPIPSDEELLKNRSAIFATDFSSDSCCYSDNENNKINDTKKSSSSSTNFKLNPTAQVFQPRFI